MGIIVTDIKNIYFKGVTSSARRAVNVNAVGTNIQRLDALVGIALALVGVHQLHQCVGVDNKSLLGEIFFPLYHPQQKMQTAFSPIRRRESLAALSGGDVPAYTRDKWRAECIPIMKKHGFRAVRYTVREWIAPAEREVREGELLRVHLPYPCECPEQSDITLNYSSHPVYISSSAHRTAFIETECRAGEKYEIEFSYTFKVNYVKAHADAVSAERPSFYTGEQYPHIRFTPYIRELADEFADVFIPLDELFAEAIKKLLAEIDLEALSVQLREELKGTKNALVSVMWANNETGTVFPIKEIAEIAKEFGAVMHTDAVQIAGKERIDVQKIPVDMLAISGHKFHAPKGVGVLYVRKGTKFKPFMIGGHQENSRRAGTENVPYIVGLAKACELAMSNLDEEVETVGLMRDKLEEGILKSCPDVRINGDKAHRLSNTLNVSFEYIEGEAIAYRLSVPPGSTVTTPPPLQKN